MNFVVYQLIYELKERLSNVADFWMEIRKSPTALTLLMKVRSRFSFSVRGLIIGYSKEFILTPWLQIAVYYHSDKKKIPHGIIGNAVPRSLYPSCPCGLYHQFISHFMCKELMKCACIGKWQQILLIFLLVLQQCGQIQIGWKFYKNSVYKFALM